MNVQAALLQSKADPCNLDCVYRGGGLCPVFWRRVFRYVNECDPANTADPRWDALFKEGMPIMRGLK